MSKTKQQVKQAKISVLDSNVAELCKLLRDNGIDPNKAVQKELSRLKQALKNSPEKVKQNFLHLQ